MLWCGPIDSSDCLAVNLCWDKSCMAQMDFEWKIRFLRQRTLFKKNNNLIDIFLTYETWMINHCLHTLQFSMQFLAHKRANCTAPLCSGRRQMDFRGAWLWGVCLTPQEAALVSAGFNQHPDFVHNGGPSRCSVAALDNSMLKYSLYVF